jgi:1,6-anhydro-N-acetylmuramate kinase
MKDEYDFSQSIPNPYKKSKQSIAIDNISTTEADLLQKITHCIPHKMQTRFNELVKQRQADTIDHTSLQELCDLSNQIELLEADRIQQLAQLAQMRSTSIEDLIKHLHIIPVNHAKT